MSPAKVLSALFFALYSSYSLVRHRAYQTTGFDLGIFEQTVRSYAEGRRPVADLLGPGVPTLGDHFHPTLVVLAPFYRLWPGPQTLLIAQAALLALSVIPVTRLAVDLLGNLRGTAVGACYGLSWGLYNMVAFDFHEVCFAVPLLAFGLEQLARRHWARAAAWVVPLALVKEDLPFTVAAIGIYLLAHRRVWLGAALAGFGTSSGLLLVLVVLPAINDNGNYAHAGNLAGGLDNLTAGLGIKALTVLLLLGSTAFLCARSPLALLTLPTLSWRFISNNSNHWSIAFHYSAILMPIIFIAFVDAMSRLGQPGRRRLARIANVAVPIALAVTSCVTASQVLRTSSPPAWTYVQQREATDVLARIPNGATVAASNRLAPHLTARCRVLLFPRYPDSRRWPEWAVVARRSDGWPVSADQAEERLAALRRDGYAVVAESNDVVLLRNGSEGP